MGRANLAVAGFVAGSALLVAAADPGGRGRAEGPVQSWLQPRPGQVLVIAHRGHSTDHPENTRAAFEAALRSGAELVETDVRMSREGELFCWHGERLARRRLSQLSADELSAHGVLRLAEFLELMGERVGVVLDLKQRNRGYTERVLAEVRQLGFLGRSVFGVHQVEHAALLRELEPGAAILGFLREPNQIPAFFAAGGDPDRA